jgi:hypothetical protein
MTTNYIPKNQLVHGSYYDGLCRNTSLARWDEENDTFWHWRTKFSERFTETISHPDDDHTYDVFYPLKKVERATTVIPMKRVTDD